MWTNITRGRVFFSKNPPIIYIALLSLYLLLEIKYVVLIERFIQDKERAPNSQENWWHEYGYQLQHPPIDSSSTSPLPISFCSKQSCRKKHPLKRDYCHCLLEEGFLYIYWWFFFTCVELGMVVSASFYKQYKLGCWYEIFVCRKAHCLSGCYN